MTSEFVTKEAIPNLPLWDRMKAKRSLVSITLEITARCNNDCLHCYINLPANHKEAQAAELTIEEIDRIANESMELGALWCLISGGEPLLREDFKEIYLLLKRKGLLISVFTNAATITQEHIDLFKKYPPRDIEVSVYGVSEETYEKVTRKPGSFKRFMKGLDLLLKNDIKVRFKAMALRSNVHELSEIAKFCKARTKDYFRFDPQLHLRFDRDLARNEEIRSERLNAEEIVVLERADDERHQGLIEHCDVLIQEAACGESNCNHLFHCGIGTGYIVVGFDGTARACTSLVHPDTICDLRKENLREYWEKVLPKVMDLRHDSQELRDTCRICPYVNLCLWCPAHAYLETGAMDRHVPFFCSIAKARAAAIKEDFQKEEALKNKV